MRLLESFGCKEEDIIKMGFRKIKCEDVNWTEVTQYKF
jgi:hypothetical protein